MVKTGVLTTSGKRTVDLREVNQYAGRAYREVESFGVQVTVTDHGRPVARIVPIREDESWCERMVREGRVRLARNGWRMPEARWQVPESLGLEEFLLGECDEDRWSTSTRRLRSSPCSDNQVQATPRGSSWMLFTWRPRHCWMTRAIRSRY